MRYLYRCDECGYEFLRVQPMTKEVPETLEDGYPHDDVCPGQLSRVYEPSLINMGYREGFHNSTEHWRFKHLSKD